jgi:two-component system phosphate regulon response regulator PhoB
MCSHKETVLVADDDRIVVELLSLGLCARGFAVTVAADAMQVIMAVRRAPPAAILLDVVMPGGTGYEALKRLRANAATNAIPIVAMSAGTDSELPQKVRELGANAFLLKPVRLDEVAATLRQLLPKPAGLTPLDS